MAEEKVGFLKKFVNWVKGWNLGKFFRGFVNGDQDAADDLKATVEMSNNFVGKVIGWLESPVGDLLENVIPGDWDAELRDKATAALARIAKNTAFLTGCAELPTVGEQLSCAYGKIVGLGDEDEVKSFKHKLGVLLSKVFANGKLDFGDAVIASQFIFELVTQKKN